MHLPLSRQCSRSGTLHCKLLHRQTYSSWCPRLPTLPLQVLWGIFLDHITEVMRSSAAHVRNAAIDALEKVVTGALAPGRRHSLASSRQQSMSPVRPAALEQQASTGPSREQEDAVENMVLVALESFYREEHAEEQVGVLAGGVWWGAAAGVCSSSHAE
jgi:hypothetical protein